MGLRSKESDNEFPKNRVKKSEVDVLIAHLRLHQMKNNARMVERMWEEIDLYRRAVEGLRNK
jgi:hypothetical protein